MARLHLVGLLAAALLCGAAAAAPAPHSVVAFTLPDREMLPESLAWDPKTESFLVGSTRHGSILRVGKDGKVSPFIAPRSGGLWMVIGIKADLARRRLWVASSAGGNLENYSASGGRPAGLFCFDLDSGAPLGRHVLDEPGVEHFFNDLVVAANGDVYTTHMFGTGQVWRLEAVSGRFEPFFRGAADFHNPNGIALAADGKHLYVAEDAGISRIDLVTAERRLLDADPGMKLGGVDGLYFHRGTLIGIQSHRVMRWRLDPTGTRVTSEDVLESEHPAFDTPTTGVFVDDWLYYIPNAQFDRFDKEGVVNLQPPMVLKLQVAP
jgi:hypothetical protein